MSKAVDFGSRTCLLRARIRRAWPANPFKRALGQAIDDMSRTAPQAEITRVLRREGLPVSNRDQIIDYAHLAPVDHAILNEAEAIILQIKTLDAIHLASALRYGLDELVIVTHDKNMAHVAEQLGFPVHDPVR